MSYSSVISHYEYFFYKIHYLYGEVLPSSYDMIPFYFVLQIYYWTENDCNYDFNE